MASSHSSVSLRQILNKFEFNLEFALHCHSGAYSSQPSDERVTGREAAVPADGESFLKANLKLLSTTVWIRLAVPYSWPDSGRLSAKLKKISPREAFSLLSCNCCTANTDISFVKATTPSDDRELLYGLPTRHPPRSFMNHVEKSLFSWYAFTLSVNK